MPLVEQESADSTTAGKFDRRPSGAASRASRIGKVPAAGAHFVPHRQVFTADKPSLSGA
jgi:hypothetical protein